MSAVFIGTDVVSHEKAALVGKHLEGGHGRRLVTTLHAPRLQ